MKRSLIGNSVRILLVVCSAAGIPGASRSFVHPLQSLGEIFALTNAEADESIPVNFKAQVLLASRTPDWLFVQAHEQGLFVFPPQSGFLPTAGDWVSISGRTAKGGLDPIVRAERMVVTGHDPLPAALDLGDSPPSPSVLTNVEAKLTGFILEVLPTSLPRTTRLLLRLRTGNVMLVAVAHSEACDPDRLVHATAELTGVYGVVGTRGTLFMDSCAGIRTIKSPRIVWDLPIVPIDELLTVRSATKIGDIVHVRGQVTMLDPALQSLHIQQKRRGISIHLAAPAEGYRVGQSIDVIGLLDADARLLLCITGARVKQASVKEVAVPVEAEAGTAIDANLNGTLLKVDGLVTSSRVNAGNLELVIGQGRYKLSATIPIVTGYQGYLPQAGDSIIATGILDVGSDREVFGYTLLLLARSFSDLQVVSRRVWYRRVDWGRVAAALGTLAAAFVAIAIFWWRRAVKRAMEAAELTRTNEVLTKYLSELGAEANPIKAVRIALSEILSHSSARGLRWFEYDAGTEALHLALVLPDANAVELPGQAAAGYAEAGRLLRSLLAAEEDAGVHPISRAAGSDWIPVHLGRRLLGLIQLIDRNRPSFPQQEEELLQTLARYLAFAVHLARLVQRANLTATLEERNRIAREMHDSLTQYFTGILMQLQAAAKYAVRDDATTLACIRRGQTLAREGLREARNSVVNLMEAPEASFDLEQRLRTLLEAATGATDLTFELRVSGEVHPLDQKTTQNLIRICQEVLSNAQRYASAHCIFVDLTFEVERVTLALRDDGVGFSPEEAVERGFGITGMRARAARLNADFNLESVHGKGTSVSVSVPYHLAPMTNA